MLLAATALSPNLVFRWRQLMSEGEALRADDAVVAASEVRRLERAGARAATALCRDFSSSRLRKKSRVSFLGTTYSAPSSQICHTSCRSLTQKRLFPQPARHLDIVAARFLKIRHTIIRIA